MKLIRAFYIDAELQTVSEVAIIPTFASYKKTLEAQKIASIYLENDGEIFLYLNYDYMSSPQKGYFKLKSFPNELYAGNGLVVGIEFIWDEYPETSQDGDMSMTLETFKSLVTF